MPVCSAASLYYAAILTSPIGINRSLYSGKFYDIPLAISHAWITGIGLWTRGANRKQASPLHFHLSRRVAGRLGIIAAFFSPALAGGLWWIPNSQRIRSFSPGPQLWRGTAQWESWFSSVRLLLDRELIRLLNALARLLRKPETIARHRCGVGKTGFDWTTGGRRCHELNNPLPLCWGYSDLLADTDSHRPHRNWRREFGLAMRGRLVSSRQSLSFAKQGLPLALVDLNALAVRHLSTLAAAVARFKIDCALALRQSFY